MSNSHLSIYGNEEVYQQSKDNAAFLEKKEKLIERLIEIRKKYDPEYGHQEADDLLLGYINDDDISQAFNDIEKWYA